MEQITIETSLRLEYGKKESKKLRKFELIPAVIYGKDSPPVSLTIARKELAKALQSGATHKLINLQINNNESPTQKLCLIHAIQRDPLQKRVLHVDFRQISLTEKITAIIPLKLAGEPKGLKSGGILDHVIWEIPVLALPTQMPEVLTLDVTNLGIGHSIHVKDIPISEGVKILEEPDKVAVVVHPPKVEVAPSPIEGAVTPAQPEVISKGKPEKEEEAAQPKGGKEKK